MSTQESNANIYDSLVVGEQLAHLEYIVTPDLLEEYQESGTGRVLRDCC